MRRLGSNYVLPKEKPSFAVIIATLATLAKLAVIVGVAAWLISGRQRRHSAAPPAPAAAPSKPTASPTSHTLWPPASTSVTAPLPSSGDTIEICGAGRVDSKDPYGVSVNLSKIADPRSTQWLNALLNSDDNRARAAGLILQGKVAAGLEGRVMTDESRDTLVQLAVGGNDAAIYGLAVYACRTDREVLPDGACPQLSLSHWAHMDAANVVPWLLLAQQARERGDGAGAATAFAQAAKAQRVDSYNYSLFAFADSDRPTDTTPFESAFFEVEVSGVESAIGMPYAQAASKSCSDQALQDIDIRQQCDAVARLFVEKSTTIIDFAIGAGLGKKVGWPPQRTDALILEKLAMMEAQIEAGPAVDDPWSCSSVAHINEFWRQRLRLGELEAAREALSQTGEAPEQLARRFDERLSKVTPQSN